MKERGGEDSGERVLLRRHRVGRFLCDARELNAARIEAVDEVRPAEGGGRRQHSERNRLHTAPQQATPQRQGRAHTASHRQTLCSAVQCSACAVLPALMLVVVRALVLL
jgi:hypothetical protein